MILLLKLILAHLIGDFLLQPHSWVTDKESRKLRSRKLYVHVLLHGVLTSILLWDHELWLAVLIIVVTHYLIDLAKVYLQKPETRITWFLADQLLHLVVIAGVWYALAAPEPFPADINGEKLLLLGTAAIFLTNPTSVIIRMVISNWTPDTLHNVGSSLPDAGKFIGFLERLLVFTFILYNHWEAVGFLLAAKSVFRFGNLKESHDRKLTEYVLIGTLLSFGIAIAVALTTAAVLIYASPTP